MLLTAVALPLSAAEPVQHSFLVTGRETYIVEAPTAATSPESGAAVVFEDFEQEDWAGWTVEGSAFGPGPVKVPDIPDYQGDVGAVGTRVVNSHNARESDSVPAGDAHTGKLTSASFRIRHGWIRMRVGGGAHAGKTCVNLVVDGKAVASVTGDASNRMSEKTIDARAWVGRDAVLEIVDAHEGGWGNIGVDHIVFDDRGAAGPTISWRYPASSRDGWVLDNGHVLLALANAVVEVDRERGEKVFEYKGRQKEIQAVQPLPNGRVLVVEGGREPTLMELDRATGEAAVTIPLQCQKDNIHMQTRMARKLGNGNYLVPHLLDFAVKEYAPNGEVVRTLRTDDQGRDAKSWPFTAIRLPNGNTLVGCTYANRVIELAPDNRIVWQLDNSDLPSPMIKDACGVQRLPNGNTVVAAYGARGPDAVKLIEVTPDKKVVWTHRSGRSHGIHHFQILDPDARKQPMK